MRWQASTASSCTAEHGLLGYRKAHVPEQAGSAFLVARQRSRDGTGVAGDRGLDAFLILAVAELHQAVIVEP